jgi:hypothetical protein
MNAGPLIASISGLIGLFTGGESRDEQIVREIGNLKTMIGDLSTNMNYRFDRQLQPAATTVSPCAATARSLVGETTRPARPPYPPPRRT